MGDTSATNSPSLASLVKALTIAVAIAVVLLVLVVLPAERNIDITGFGRAIGLTVLSAPPAEPATQPIAPSVPKGEHKVVIDVPAGTGLEYKFRIRTGEKMEYAWRTGSGELLYDFHGEPAGAAKDVFESYASGKASSVKGTLTTPFEGTHGWYWKNMGKEPIQVTLVTTGAYEVLGVK